MVALARSRLMARAVLALGALMAIGTAGCAVFDDDNRLLLNTLDEKIRPKTTGAQLALAPVAIPAGAVALAIDGAVINPVRAVPTAADDTRKLYWDYDSQGMLHDSLLFPVRVVLTPPTFAGDWAVRSMLEPED